eukprot:1147653-Pelagomonas_calceolata.AAC.1
MQSCMPEQHRGWLSAYPPSFQEKRASSLAPNGTGLSKAHSMPQCKQAVLNGLLGSCSADLRSKAFQDLGLPGVTVGHSGSGVLPLVHIEPTVVSKVLYGGMSVEGKGLLWAPGLALDVVSCNDAAEASHLPITCLASPSYKNVLTLAVTG